MYTRGLQALCIHRGTETDPAYSRPSAAGYPQDSMGVEGQGVSLQGVKFRGTTASAVWVLWMMGGGDSATAAVVLDCNKMPEEAAYEKRLTLAPQGDFSHLALRLCHIRQHVGMQSDLFQADSRRPRGQGYLVLPSKPQVPQWAS